jgi:hypothetical protein
LNNKIIICHNNFILGNISKVRWHTSSYKVSQNNYSHMLESFDEEMNDGVNQNLLNYFILLETKMIVMNTCLTDIETKIKEQEDTKNKVINNQNSYLPHFRFRFF